jgi:hypothetical protein
MGREGYVARMEVIRNTYKVVIEKFEGIISLGDRGVNVMIILKYVLKLQCVTVWTGCMWLRAETTGELL